MSLTHKLEFVGMVLTTVGLYLMSVQQLLVAFSIGVVASIIWIIFAHRTKAKYLLTLNIILGFININGIINTWN